MEENSFFLLQIIIKNLPTEPVKSAERRQPVPADPYKGRILDPSGRILEPSASSTMDPSRRMDPSRVAIDPLKHRIMDPTRRVIDPSAVRSLDPAAARMLDPLGRVVDPAGRLIDPAGRIIDPMGRVMDPATGRILDPTDPRANLVYPKVIFFLHAIYFIAVKNCSHFN